MPPRALRSIAAPIWSKVPATAPSATARATCFGGLIPGRRFAGGIDAEGKGWVPNITPHADGLAKWSEKDIAYLLETGSTPDFDSVGSTMADVAANTGKLSPEDRAAMAAYIKSLPPRPGKNPQKK